jgi:hypothetical protein
MQRRQPEIYRAIIPALAPYKPGQLQTTGHSVRPPINVPNVVDNLWEWVRPIKFPNRRFSVFASPTRDLAVKQGPENGRIYRLEFVGEYKMCQLKGYANSKKHPECISLPIFLYEKLGDEWINRSLAQKSEAGRLWLPCLSKVEVDSLFGKIAVLHRMRKELLNKIRYWNDVVSVDISNPSIDHEGEIFFETSEGYYLRPLVQD